MIYFLAPEGQTFGMDDYLRQAGQGLQGRIVVRTYESVMAQRVLPLGTYVFAAVDQLTVTEARLATRMWAALSAARPASPLLNDPDRVMCRYELLRAAQAAGRNTFRAFRLGEIPADLRFPVFVRLEREHTGSLTPVLADRRALRRALLALRLRGYRGRDLLVVEYCDTADEGGLLRKYSAYAVGGCIIPCMLVIGPNWVTKSAGRQVDEVTAREELDYVRDNPHREWLRETFALARVDYGRIDYGVRDGRPQVWEINLNPTLGRRLGSAGHLTDEQRRLRAPAREHVAAQFQAAFEAIDRAPPPGLTVPFEVADPEVRRLRRERGRRRRVEARRALVLRLAHVPPVGWLRRAAGKVWPA